MNDGRLDTCTPVGRMVQGNPFEATNTDMKGKPLTDKHGNPRVEYFLAVAVPKTDPGINAFWGQLQQMATAGFPGGQSAVEGFSWKVVDGDNPKYAGKDGFAGCWVIRMSSGYAITVHKKVEGTVDQYAQIVSPDQLKRGHYVRCYVSIKPNGDATYPGMYINPSMVEWIGYGEEIQGGPDAAAIFGATPAAMPAGASTTPIAGPPLATPAGPPVTPPAGPPVTPPAGPPVTPPAGPPVTPPAAKQMTAKAGATTYEAYIAAGWTDAQLIAEGMMLAGVAPAPDFLTPKQMTVKAGATTYEAYIAAGWTDAQLIAEGMMLP